MGTVRLVDPLDESTSQLGREHMSDNQSRNHGMMAVPAPGTVTIDGDLGDWDLSGRISSFADIRHRDQYAVDTALMWDEEYLYVAFQWTDETPMHNMLDPDFDYITGWKSDSFALRVATDHTFWMTGHYYTGEAQHLFYIEEWNDPNNRRTEGVKTTKILIGEPGATELGEGVEMATVETEIGYTQEIRIPWAMFYKDLPTIEPGLTWQMGFEYIWGDPTGKTWPQHRYADNLQPGEDKLLFFWEAKNVWGDVTLSAEGNLPLRTYREASDSLTGPIEINLPLPEDATTFTVVVDDSQGHRVRNLAADRIAADYRIGTEGDRQFIRIFWDGRDDSGKPVAPGNYQIRGL
ncbi:MAG: sugar-binding protein, partial [Puniceicoccales bacterium]